MKKRNISILSWSKEKCRSWVFLFKPVAVILLPVSLIGVLSCERHNTAAPSLSTNSPPAISSVRILPEKPVSDDDLSLSVESHDRDGDPIMYEYEWSKNGGEISRENKNVLRKRQYRKGDLIEVKVTPYDAKEKGASVLASIRILNSPPVVQDVWINPRTALASDSLKAMCKAEDEDGDFIYFTYQWERNGVILSDERSDVLERGRFRKGDSITVTITPDDREALGDPKKANAILISNSPPVITSSPPSRTAGNSYVYQVKVSDPDDDPVTFTLKSGPKGMKINDASGLIQWEIKKEDKGVFPVEIEASDPEGEKSIQRYTLTVDLK